MKKSNKSIPGISIIIPCYNEENNLRRGVLDQVKSFLTKQSYPWEVLICNDASTDKSLIFLQKFHQNNPNFRLIDLPHGGKASAIWGGVQQARFPYVLFTDMDQSTPINELSKLLPYISENYQAIIGSRGVSRDNTSIIRKIMSSVFFVFRKSLLLSSLNDTQCGFKVFNTKIIKQLFPYLAAIKNQVQSSGWRVSAYDVELLFLIEKNGFKIKEVPVAWKNEDTSTSKGDSSRFKKESINMAKEVIRVKLNDIKGLYQHCNAKI